MSVEVNRRLGGYGAALTFVGAISTVLSVFQYGNLNAPTAASLVVSSVASFVGIFTLVGFILFLIAMYGFSKIYGERRIFNYVIYGIIAAIILGVITFAAILAVFFANLPSLISSIDPSTPPSSSAITSVVLPFIAPMIAVFAAVALVVIVFYMLAFNLLAKKSGVPLFRVGAKILLAGVIVSLAVGVVFAVLAVNGSIDYVTFLMAGVPGGLVQEIGWIVLAFAFFRIKAAPADAALAPQKAVYCFNCGTPNQPDATYCIHCGQAIRR